MSREEFLAGCAILFSTHCRTGAYETFRTTAGEVFEVGITLDGWCYLWSDAGMRSVGDDVRSVGEILWDGGERDLPELWRIA